MKNIFKKLEEKITVKESLQWKLSKSELIFRNEFDEHLEKYKFSKDENDLIFVFITLQIYVENFLHYKMRTFISLEFNYDSQKVEKWEKECEFKYIDDKINNKTKNVKRGKLRRLIDFVSLQENEEVNEIKEIIEEKFKKITDIRNRMIHGHEISTSGSSENDNCLDSKTKRYLTEESLGKIIKEVNVLGENWNKLVDIFFKNTKSLNGVDIFYFEKIKNKS